ncbi:MAG TPA: FtsW/RodA/SpoVE family cell cycle protein [Candidatus Egerieimonas faecigallinarum]|nr:FtsW/RodA/SpoVE family cell cycle protein [Candidatus Egerieimonas faecigallinarum]
MLRRYKLKNYNFRLVLWILVLSAIGVILVGSAMKSLQMRQLAGVIGGVVLMVIVSLMDFSWILNFYWVIYGANIVLLLLLIPLGSEQLGATRWISIGGFQFQPTELSKIFLILFFAQYLMKHEDDLNTLKTILTSVVLLAVPLVLILIQPDLKNTITVAVVFCFLMYMAGLSYKIIGGILGVVIPVGVVLMILITQTDLPIIQDYQKTRIMAWLNPEDAEYSDDIIQQQNSITAIGSGQLTGKGLNNNEVASVNKGNFVSQNHNDFIFAVAGEEMGFLGCCLIILLLFMVVFECIRTGSRAKNLSGTLICAGVGSMVGFQSFLNICVATGLFPNTGTPLPFVSYGLTSLWTLYISMGFVLNVGLQDISYLNKNRNNLKGDRNKHERRINRT